MKSCPKPSLFDYLDYRSYLKSWYAFQKQAERHFSFRAFSQRAGFSSPNFLKLVMEGDRNLTETSLNKFVKGLRLNKGEEDFFRNLVFYNQATEPDQKNLYYKKLISSQRFRQLKPLSKHLYEYLSQWYHPVVRELVVSDSFDGTPESISKIIQPRIAPDKIAKSISLLEKLGFIQKQADGKYVQSEPVTSTGSSVPDIAVMNYHQSLLQVMHHLLPRVDENSRDVRALTIGIPQRRVPDFKRLIDEFCEKIVKTFSDEVENETVLLLGLQLMPVVPPKTPKTQISSKKKTKGKK